MARKSSWNPIAFVPTQVTFISTAVYIALFASLLYVHHIVPPAPSSAAPEKGFNLTEAWQDVEKISDGFHPYNSRRNEVVRSYLAGRIESILESNGVGKDDATFWNGGDENVTFVDKWRGMPWTCYTESENLIVYIRGEEDDGGAWWERPGRYEGVGGSLLSAHYDSVSTGYGATDDGVGVATILQLISYFTTDGQKPRTGIVALLNNGEEDGLYGAYAYTHHPTRKFVKTFLNLEGAGAGGRATLFRSTDAEVTEFYAGSRRPFGTVVSGDGFKQGFVRSGTDYSVYNEEFGLRGLDVAFMDPRSRYHTDQDDARDTSPDSLWHMLSGALDSLKAMTSYDGDEFSGSQRKKDGTMKGSNGVWFDVLGRTFAVMRLHDMFALSVTLLVAAPVLLIILEIIIAKSDKWYPFSRKQYLHSSDDDEPIHINGLRGFFRFPLAFAIATAAVAALAFLLAKINPLILYSSEYAVWSMMLSGWFSIAWFFFTMFDRIRPTALSRMYAIMWMYIISWMLLVVTTIAENNLNLGGGYFLVVYNASVFAALLISYLELLALPTKSKYVEHVAAVGSAPPTRPASISSRNMLDGQGEDRPRTSEANDEDANERTGLLRGDDRRSQQTFTRFGRRRGNHDTIASLEESDDPLLSKAYGEEQAWSGALPRWTWILQFLLLAPINVILSGQVALFITTSLHQTPADGNAVLPLYLMTAGLSVLLMIPLAPFIHRFTFHLPTLFFFVFVGCLVYNLLAFPFSREARLKHYFVQTLDLDTGANTVSLTGLNGFIQDIIEELPSAAGQTLNCSDPDDPRRKGLQTCSWTGLPPNVVFSSQKGIAPYGNKTDKYKDWLAYNVTTTNTTATFSFRGAQTRNCRLTFDSPITHLSIASTTSSSADVVAQNGTTELRLFSRSWDKRFEVEVGWPNGEVVGKEGKVGCLWSEVNDGGVVPALDEVWAYEPVWSAVSKAGDGLVEGWKRWEI